jgi:L-serine deaminase
MRVPVELLVALVAGLFGLVPAMLQITATMLQRRDKATRLNNLRAEL